MIRTGVEEEILCGEYAIVDEIPGLNNQMIGEYIRYLGNLRSSALGLGLLYEGGRTEPESTSWISSYSNANLVKTDFFEAKSTAYSKAAAFKDDL